MSRFEVLVGNVGAVYDGRDEELARATYAAYAGLVRLGRGGRAGAPVTLLRDGEVVEETP